MKLHSCTGVARKMLVTAGLLACLLLTSGNVRSLAQQQKVSTFTLVNRTPPQLSDGTATLAGHYPSNKMLRLALALKSPNAAEEEQLVRELTDPTSPNYRQFLTPEESIRRFSPSAEDEQRVVDWARSQGLTVTHRYPNRLLVDVEATAGTIEQVFGVTINQYKVGADLDFSIDRDPLLPASLADVVTTVMGLNNIQRMQPGMREFGEPALPDYAPGPVAELGEQSHGPEYTPETEPSDGSEPMITSNLLDPNDIASAQLYNYKALASIDHCCNPHNDSNGSPNVSSIALAAWGDVNLTDAVTFFGKMGMNWNLTKVHIDGTPACDPGQSPPCFSGETTLDTEYSGAMANTPSSWKTTAHVYIYIDGTWSQSGYADVFNQMLTDNKARVMSTSWGCTENYGCSSDDINVWHGIFNKMINQGWTLLAASGDTGASNDCYIYWDKNSKTYTQGSHTSVNYPSSDPDLMAVGGTQANGYIDAQNHFVWQGEPAWTGETYWGACAGNHGGSTGGVSAIFSQPGYQKGLGGTMRLVPDIALNSATGQFMYYDGAVHGVIGTSIASPELAGFFARENSYLNYIGSICGSNHKSACTPIGGPHGAIYYQAMKNYAQHNPFYDIMSGCNTNDVTAHWGLKTFCAKKGFDEVTGWGTANMLQLAWALNWGVLNNFANGVPSVKFTGPTVNKWYNTNQTVSFSIVDYSGNVTNPHPTGIAGVTQGWNSIPADPATEPHPGTGNSFWDGPQRPNAFTGCLSFTGYGCTSDNGAQGCHTAHVRGWNNEGITTGDATYGPVCYDNVAPTATHANAPAAPASGWYNSAVTVTLAAADAGGSNASGVAAIDYSINNTGCKTTSTAACLVYTKPFKVGTEGVNNVILFASDKAGNYSSVTTDTVKVDLTAPKTTITLTGTGTNLGYTSAVKATLAATDNLSGVAATFYTLDGGAATKYIGAFNVTTSGSHTIKYWSQDAAGNNEQPSTKTFTVTLKS